MPFGDYYWGTGSIGVSSTSSTWNVTSGAAYPPANPTIGAIRLIADVEAMRKVIERDYPEAKFRLEPIPAGDAFGWTCLKCKNGGTVTMVEIYASGAFRALITAHLHRAAPRTKGMPELDL